jgi:hypothetical protein
MATQQKLGFHVVERQAPQGVIEEIRRKHGFGPDKHDFLVFYACYRHCLGTEVAQRITRVPYERYNHYAGSGKPVEYELPPEITGAIAPGAEYRNMDAPWAFHLPAP